MVSLSKIKRLFFIILVLSFLTENDCYCVFPFGKKKKTTEKNEQIPLIPKKKKEEGNKLVSFFKNINFFNKDKDKGVGKKDNYENIFIENQKKILNREIRKNNIALNEEEKLKISFNRYEEMEEEEEEEEKEDEKEGGEEKMLSKVILGNKSFVSDDSLFPSLNDVERETLLNKLVIKEKEKGNSIHVKNDKEMEKNISFLSINDKDMEKNISFISLDDSSFFFDDSLFSFVNKEQQNSKKLNRTVNEIKNGKKKNKLKRVKQKKMKKRNFSKKIQPYRDLYKLRQPYRDLYKLRQPYRDLYKLKKEDHKVEEKKEEQKPEEIKEEPKIEEKKEEKQKKSIRMLKTLRWFGFIAKPIGSLLWSYANSLYHLEDIELDKVYFCKYILCVGYRWQPKFMLNFMNKFMPNFMKEKGFFFDINISPVSIVYSIFCTYIQYQIDRRGYNVCRWKWILGKSIFYTLPNSLNFNLNIKVKDIYFAINFSGIIAELLDVILLSRIRNLKEQDESKGKLQGPYDDNTSEKNLQKEKISKGNNINEEIKEQNEEEEEEKNIKIKNNISVSQTTTVKKTNINIKSEKGNTNIKEPKNNINNNIKEPKNDINNNIEEPKIL